MEFKNTNTTLAFTIQTMVMAKRNEMGVYIDCSDQKEYTAEDIDVVDLNVTQVLVSRMDMKDGEMRHVLLNHVDGDEALELIKKVTVYKHAV